MQAAGFNVVRMAEFAWDLMEPVEGDFDFALFDQTIARLGERGIDTILCTPTATPPRWLTARHPEMLRVNGANLPMTHGSRQHVDLAHPTFREHSRRITRAMAEHFAGNPHVIGWQTDNEFYCHLDDDHGPATQEAFREYLRRRYDGDIAELNRAWGTQFWAQTYADFDQIETPRPMRPTFLNPGHDLDYRRALSWIATEFQHDQVELLRAANPNWFVFHNGIFGGIDFHGPFTEDLDFLGYDVYPFFEKNSALRPATHAFNCDRARAWSGNFLVPEHQAGPGGQAPYFHNNPEPGEMRRMTYATIARGADSLLYFRWRTCRFGAEQYWCGILDHDNVPRRRYDETKQVGEELAKIGPDLLGSHVTFDVGIAMAAYDVREADSTYPQGLPSSQNCGEDVHGVFWKRGFAVGCCHPTDLPDDLKLYVIPQWLLFDPAWVAPLERWVEAGGTLVIGARTATRDLENQIIAATPPGCLASLAGVTVDETGCENDPARIKKIVGDTFETRGERWYEVLAPADGTETIARWSGRHLDGQPAVTLRNIGQGRVITVGTYLTARGHRRNARDSRRTSRTHHPDFGSSHRTGGRPAPDG